MNLLAMFAKHWQPGAVKTRLAARWGEQRASQLYLAFLETLVARMGGMGDERWLVFTPLAARAAFKELVPAGWTLRQQSSGDLGQRMAALFADAFDHGADRCVLIGSDSPTLPPAHVKRAFEALEHVPVVLGPARDGGYCLIGARGSVPPIFEEIDWSTSRVLDQTVARLRSAGVAFELLSPWYDVDTPEDVERLREDLRRAGDDLAALRAVIQGIVPLE
jgi:rSAM/selenodomain-associated transferase 1